MKARLGDQSTRVDLLCFFQQGWCVQSVLSCSLQCLFPVLSSCTPFIDSQEIRYRRRADVIGDPL